MWKKNRNRNPIRNYSLLCSVCSFDTLKLIKKKKPRKNGSRRKTNRTRKNTHRHITHPSMHLCIQRITMNATRQFFFRNLFFLSEKGRKKEKVKKNDKTKQNIETMKKKETL